MAANEVEKQEPTQPPAMSPREAIRVTLDKYRPVFAKLLVESGVSEDTFGAQIANALRATPALWTCRVETVLGAALRCAQLGLSPNDGRNLCWIIPYGSDAQFQLGYGGVLELARRADPGITFDGRPVYPNDEFDLDYGRDAQPLIHRPAVSLGRPRGGDAFAWYVRARYPDERAPLIHHLDRDGVEYHRSFSKIRKGGMWDTSYDAAALKSVVFDMRRWLPQTTQLVAAVASDESVLDIEHSDLELDPLTDHEPTTEGEQNNGTTD